MSARPTIPGSMSVAAAIKWMGWRREDAARWLADEGLILVIDDGERVRKRVLRVDLEERYRQVGRVARPARRPAASRRPDQGREASDDMARWPRPIVMGDVRARPKKSRGRRDRPDGPTIPAGACVYWEARRSIGGKRITIWSGWATRPAAERAVADAWRESESPREPEWGIPRSGSNAQHAPGAEPLYRRPLSGADICTVQELLDAWIDDRERLGLVRPATLESNRMSSARICELIGHLHPIEVSTRVLRSFVARRRQDVGEGTVEQNVKALMSALRWARETRRVDIAELPVPPALDYKPARGSEPPGQRTLRLMFNALRHGVEPQAEGDKRVEPDVETADALELQLRVGARTGELHNLRWRDIIDGSAGPCLRLDGKTDQRLIPLVPATIELLDAIRERRPGGPGERIITDRSLCGWHSHVRTVLAGLPWARWGVQRIRPNDLRAEYSQRVLDSGASLSEFKALTGHSAATALRYYHRATPAALAARMGRVDISAAMDVQIVPLLGAKRDDR